MITKLRASIKWVVAGLVVAIVVAAFGIAIWYQMATQPLSHDSKQVSFTLAAGRGVSGLAEDLQSRGIIRSSRAFNWYVTLHGLRRGLQAGSYSLSPSESVAKIATKIGHGSVVVNQFVVPEGKTVAQIRKLAKAKGVDDAAFELALKDSYANSFLAAKPATVDLEGYLFPDSYTLPRSVSAHTLIQQMLDNFGRKVATPDITAGLAAQGLTLHQGLTLASIVEREVAHADDRAAVAGVFLNRLKLNQPLQSDVTVQYAADINNIAFNLNFDSAYNTYRHPGLPPGPICNPGLASLNAVAHPIASDYLYFVANKAGKTYYAKTFAEHQANVARYLGK